MSVGIDIVDLEEFRAGLTDSLVGEFYLPDEIKIDEYVDEDDDIEVDADTALISSGIVDSFSMVSLKAFLETKYDIRIPDEDATPEAFDTVASIVQIVERLRS